MGAFAIVLTLAVVAFSITYDLLAGDSNRENTNLMGSFRHIFLLMYGDFSVDDYSTSMWILFCIASIFMPLVMLNLLIAIMSDTYERVTNGMVEADGKELNALIIEQEQIMFWNRDKKESSHMQWVE